MFTNNTPLQNTFDEECGVYLDPRTGMVTTFIGISQLPRDAYAYKLDQYTTQPLIDTIEQRLVKEFQQQFPNGPDKRNVLSPYQRDNLTQELDNIVENAVKNDPDIVMKKGTAEHVEQCIDAFLGKANAYTMKTQESKTDQDRAIEFQDMVRNKSGWPDGCTAEQAVAHIHVIGANSGFQLDTALIRNRLYDRMENGRVEPQDVTDSKQFMSEIEAERRNNPLYQKPQIEKDVIN